MFEVRQCPLCKGESSMLYSEDCPACDEGVILLHEDIKIFSK